MNREHRNRLIDGELVLISPYDPSAGFNVGNAMQRNKLIYALADASLVVNSDLNKGGTWAGATEQLVKLRLVPVYVRSTGDASDGLDALRKKGAILWPNPQDADALEAVFDAAIPTPQAAMPIELSLFPSDKSLVSVPTMMPLVMSETTVVPAVEEEEPSPLVVKNLGEPVVVQTRVESPTVRRESKVELDGCKKVSPSEISPADTLFATVREVIQGVLIVPMKEAELATKLNVSTTQAKVWLQCLVAEGVLEKRKIERAICYISRNSCLF
jgi:predicted Rossmann fold nucleotide-binding protein DprA/Smf involved in DNA uptake